MQLQLEELPYKKIAIKNTKEDNIDIKINSLYYFEAPVEEKKIIGNVKIMLENDVLGVLSVLNENKIDKKSIKDYMQDFLKIL